MTIAGPYNDPNYVTRQQIMMPQVVGTATWNLCAFPVSNMRIRSAQIVVSVAGSASSTGKFYAGTTSIGQWTGSASTAGFTVNVADMNATIAAGTILAVAITGDNTQKFNILIEAHTDPAAVYTGP